MVDTGPQHANKCQIGMIFCADDYKSFYTKKIRKWSNLDASTMSDDKIGPESSEIGIMLIRGRV